jgi:opacity protein-like surface antigen
MKKIAIAAFLAGTALTAPAFADPTDDGRAKLSAIEKENTAIRKENAALLENKRLRDQNSRLTTSSVREPQALAPTVPVPAAPVAAAAAAEETGTWTTVKKKFSSVFSSEQKSEKKDVFEAYAADLPVKAIAPPRPGSLTFWGEGGAIWTGGDPAFADFNLIDPTRLFGLFGGGGVPAHINLDPKIGWEAAAGFDYRFANSPWHVSGQFRYGEGKASGSAASSGQLPPAVLALFGGAITAIGGSENVSVSNKEIHWIADAAVGYDIATSGRSNLQLKGGIRVGEFKTSLNSLDTTNLFFNFAAPLPPFFGGGNQISINTATNVEDLRNFLGAGPLIGMDGSVRFMGNWSFDYKGDVAILFGSQHQQITTTTSNSATPAILNQFFPGGNVNTNTADRFSYVVSADVQAGIGYWFTPNVKLAASYRLDSMINVQNTRTAASGTLLPSRYWHGPRLTLTAAFAAE